MFSKRLNTSNLIETKIGTNLGQKYRPPTQNSENNIVINIWIIVQKVSK